MIGPAPAIASPSRDDDAALTRVDLVHNAGKIEHWIRFGTAVAETIVDRRQRSLWYRPGSTLAFVRWRANAFGTVVSRIDILTIPAPGEAISTVPGVQPGGIILLRQSGWQLVTLTLAAIDAVEAIGLDPADACPDHWRQVHHHLGGRSAPRAYTLARHHAWLRRCALTSC